MGSYNSSGNPIVIPLTATTSPPLNNDLVTNANDLTVLRYRKDLNNTAEDNRAFDERKEKFLEIDLPRIFGWASGESFSTPPTLTFDVRTGPVGTVVTISGTNFRQYSELFFFIEGSSLGTTPTTPITDVLGNFTGVVVTIPTYLQAGPHFINIRDGDGTAFDANGEPIPINGAQLPFLVT